MSGRPAYLRISDILHARVLSKHNPTKKESYEKKPCCLRSPYMSQIRRSNCAKPCPNSAFVRQHRSIQVLNDPVHKEQRESDDKKKSAYNPFRAMIYCGAYSAIGIWWSDATDVVHHDWTASTNTVADNSVSSQQSLGEHGEKRQTSTVDFHVYNHRPAIAWW